MGLMEKIFGNYSDKEIKRIIPIVDKIEAYESSLYISSLVMIYSSP